MKRFGTVLFSFILLVLAAQGKAQNLQHRAYMMSPDAQQPAQVSMQHSNSQISPVFLPGHQGFVTLATYDTVPEVDSNYMDTTGGNWWFDYARGGFFDTVNNHTLPDTMYTRGLSERFVTSLAHPYLDSVQITILVDTVPPTNSLTFDVFRITDAQFGTLGVFPVPDLSQTPLRTATYSAANLTQGVTNPDGTRSLSFNTITINFHHYRMPTPSSSVRPDFAVLVNRGGSQEGRSANGVIAYNPFEDSLAFIADANVQPFDPSFTIDTTLYFTYSYSTDQYSGWETQAFFFDQKTAADTTQAFFGNMIMKAYLDDPTVPAAVSSNPALQYRLAENYPNPVSTTSEMNYNLGESGPVSLTVYNALGQKVETVVDAIQGAGEHTATFSAQNLPNGMYYYKLQSGDFTATRTMVIDR